MFLSPKTRVPQGDIRLLITMLFIFVMMVAVEPSAAEDVDFQVLMSANDITCLMESGTKVFGGLNGGGLMVWDNTDPSYYEVWNSSIKLSGNYITDLAVSGNNLWVATQDAGVTRIENAGGDNPLFRQYSGNLGSRRISAVTAAIVSGQEVAYYAMDGNGVGGISDGLPGFVFTTLDGLLSNDSNALQLYNGDLFVASDLGISQFRDNLFTTQNNGLTSVVVKDLVLDADGSLLAGGADGVFRWDASAESWISLGGIGTTVVNMSARPGEIWAVGQNNALGKYDGSSWSMSTRPHPILRTVCAGTELWIAGYTRDDAMAGASHMVYLGRRNVDGTFGVWDVAASLVRNAEGVAFGASGDVWIGSREANAVSHFNGENYDHFYELGDEANNFSGLFEHHSPFLCIALHPSGNIWASQFTRGALIINPDTGDIQQVDHNVTGMNGGQLLNMLAHPDGTMIFMHDGGYESMVDVLVDPENFADENNWVALPRGLPGLGFGTNVHDAMVERNDVIWFAVENVGLVRWDINGLSQGPDDEITWLDTSDDYWYSPVDDLPRSFANPKAAKSLALAADGSIWVGGNVVARFIYSEELGMVTQTEITLREKTSPGINGLVSGTVTDIAVDRNGDLWVTTPVGLNRVHQSGEDYLIDVYMDVENYLSNPNYGILYSSNAIVGLPGGTYKDMDVTADGTAILVSSDRGAGLVHVDKRITHESSLAGLYCYPNPFVMAEADGGLRLGGLGAGDDSDYAIVEIFNIEGQLVYSNSYVTPGVPFWNGVNRVGLPAVTGMYVVKVEWQNVTAICPLAVVR